MNETNEYRVVWQQCPHNSYDSRVLFVEAGSKDDAEKIARDHIERRFGIEWFSVRDITPTKPIPFGRVKES